MNNKPMEKTVRDRLLRVDQVAGRLNISLRSTYRLIAEGAFECCKIRGSIRVVESSVNAYIERQISLFSCEVGFFCDNSANLDNN